jgi:hypothetical protein
MHKTEMNLPAGPERIARDPENLNRFIFDNQKSISSYSYFSTGVKPPSDCINKTFKSSNLFFSNALENVSIYRFKHGVK